MTPLHKWILNEPQEPVCDCKDCQANYGIGKKEINIADMPDNNEKYDIDAR